ncbi:MAG: hypothetical protein ACPHIX_08370 [Arenicellales bacterium]
MKQISIDLTPHIRMEDWNAIDDREFHATPFVLAMDHPELNLPGITFNHA